MFLRILKILLLRMMRIMSHLAMYMKKPMRMVKKIFFVNDTSEDPNALNYKNEASKDMENATRPEELVY